MKQIEFKVGELLQKLVTVSSVISNKPVMPILSNLRIVGKDGKLNIMASDGDTFVSLLADVISIDEGIQVCINAKSFVQALSNISSEDEIVADVDESKKNVTFKYHNGKFVLPYDSTNDFPIPNTKIDGAAKVTMSSAKLLQALKKSLFAVANDDLRPMLCTIHIEIKKDSIMLAASDSKKLVRYVDNGIVSHKNDDIESSVNFPKSTCNTLIPILGMFNEVDLTYNSRSIIISNDRLLISSRLYDGKYPDFERVIPKNNYKKATLLRTDVISAIKRVLPMSSSANVLKLSFTEGKLYVAAEDMDLSMSANEELECKYEGEDLQIGFNGPNLLQIVQACDTEFIQFEMSEQSRPIIITNINIGHTDVDSLYLLMPMQIN